MPPEPPPRLIPENPPLPPGFVPESSIALPLGSAGDDTFQTPPLPPGFVPEQPPLPPGFIPEQPARTRSEQTFRELSFFQKFRKLESQLPSSLLAGAQETVAAVGSGIAGEIAGGLAGAVVAPFDADKAVDVIGNVREAVNLPPRTSAGKAGVGAVGKAFKFLGEGGKKAFSGLVGLGALGTGQGLDAAVEQIGEVQEKGAIQFLGDIGAKEFGPVGGAVGKTLIPAALLSPLLRGSPKKPPIAEGRAGTGAEATITKSQSIPPEAAPITEKAISASKPKGPAEAIKPLKSEVAPERKAYQQILDDLKKSKTKAAEQVLPDEAILKAADDLGVDLNPSHYSTNQVFIEVEQALKSRPGSKLGAVETKAIEKLGQRADELISELGGLTDKALLDFRVRNKIGTTINRLESRSDRQYAIVSNAIAPAVRVKPQASRGYLQDRLKELGGDKSLLTTAEKELLRISVEGKFPTYAALDRVRKRVGAGFRGKGPYKDDDGGVLRQVYKVLSEDQQGVADVFGVGANYAAARKLVQSRKQIEDQSIVLLGRNLSGSIIPKISQAATALTKGDVSKFRLLMETLPKGRRAEVAATLLNDIFTQGARTKGSLGQGFVKAFAGLNRNLAAKRILFQQLPKGAQARFNKLGVVATGLFRSKAFENTSGTARALLANMDDGSLFSKIQEAAGRGVAAEVVTTTVGLPGAGLAGSIFATIAKRRTPATEAADAFITSPAFSQAIQKAAQGDVAGAEVLIKRDPAFRRWLKTRNEGDVSKIGQLGFIAWLLESGKPQE